MMLLILVVVTAFELGFATQCSAVSGLAGCCLLVNVWGPLDALMRFPKAHEIESLFTLKQFLLLALKTLTLAFGIDAITDHLGLLLIVLLLNIAGLPVLYSMALPLDPAERVLKDDAYDVDLAWRLWKVLRCPGERRRCAAWCRTWWHRSLKLASERSTVLRVALCAANPDYGRIYKRTGRCV